MTTTRADLVNQVASQTDLPRVQADECIRTVLDAIVNSLHRGEKVELRGFGSFRTRDRGPRIGRNPKTGESVEVPAKRVPYFKLGKDLKESLIDAYLKKRRLEELAAS